MTSEHSHIMPIVHLQKLSNSYLQVETEPSINVELYDKFSFFMPGYEHSPKYKAGYWSGKVSLYDARNGKIYAGLVGDILDFCKTNGYDVAIDKELKSSFWDEKMTHEFFMDWIKTIPLCNADGETIEPYYYQLAAVFKGMKFKRQIIKSATGCLHPSSLILCEANGKQVVLSFEQIQNLYHQHCKIKVETPTGFEEISDVIEKFDTGHKIVLSNGRTFSGASTHKILMINDVWKNLSDVNVGDVTVNGISIVEKSDLEYQRWIDFQVLAPHSSYIQSGIVHHNTGKSLIIYLLARYFQQVAKSKTLIIVPNTGLVSQLATDFKEYSLNDPEWKVFQNVSQIYAGQSKVGLNDIVISTFQSLSTIGNESSKAAKSGKAFTKQWFEQFGAVLVDETHMADSVSISKILELCHLAEYRIGLSGTLDKDPLSDSKARGLLGPISVVQTTKQAMDNGYLAKLNIKQLVLKHPRLKKKLESYQDEMEYVCEDELRNNFLVNLACSLEGSTLLLVEKVSKHADKLYEQIKTKAGDRKVFYIKGSVDGDERTEIRQILEKSPNSILVATYGSFSTGSNVKNIHNVILGSSSKSMVRVLQTIGRGLRTSKTKTECNLYDVVDYLNAKCFSVKHAHERLKLYADEGFAWSTVNVKL